MYDHTFLNLQITSTDIKPHIKWVVSLVIAYGHFNLPQGFVWVLWVNTLTLSPQRDSLCILEIVLCVMFFKEYAQSIT